MILCFCTLKLSIYNSNKENKMFWERGFLIRFSYLWKIRFKTHLITRKTRTKKKKNRKKKQYCVSTFLLRKIHVENKHHQENDHLITFHQNQNKASCLSLFFYFLFRIRLYLNHIPPVWAIPRTTLWGTSGSPHVRRTSGLLGNQNLHTELQKHPMRSSSMFKYKLFML